MGHSCSRASVRFVTVGFAAGEGDRLLREEREAFREAARNRQGAVRPVPNFPDDF